MTDRLVLLRGQRRMGLTALGDPSAERVVVLCHPAPGAAGFDPDPAVTSSWGVHLVAADRPGYGSSPPLPADVPPRVADRADDLADYITNAIQEARESGRAPLDRVGVIGWSAGSRVALALAARHPGLVDRVALVAAPVPHAEVPWLRPDQTEAVTAARSMPLADARAGLQRLLEPDAATVGGIDALLTSDDDRAALERPGLRDRLERMMRLGYEQGTAGLADDLLSFDGDDLGFEPRQVRAPVLLVTGASDALAPAAHGRWYRRRLPHARLVVVPHAGHLVVATAWQRVLEHVDPHHGRDPRP